MSSTRTAELQCTRVAARQHGVLQRRQAQLAGLSLRQVQIRIRSGRWQVVHPGVYRIAGAPNGWHSDLKALCLWLEPECVLSHRSAAELHGFSRFEGCRAKDLTVHRRVRDAMGVTAHRTNDLPAREVTVVAGFRVTSVERTLLDLAATEDAPTVRACLDEALRRRWTTLEKFSQHLSRHGGSRGIATLKALVHEYQGGDGPTESELEQRVLDVLEAHDLPRPVKQQVVKAHDRVRRLDFRFPGTRVVLEADGYAFHAGLADFERDRTRANALVARGFIVLRWTWRALEQHPHHLVEELERVLASDTRRAA